MSKEMLKNAGNTVAKDVANLKANNDIGAIREDLQNLKEDAASLVRHTKESGQEQFAMAEEKAKKALKSAKATGRDYYADVENYVQTNPGQSLAFAFVGGILASMMFRSGR